MMRRVVLSCVMAGWVGFGISQPGMSSMVLADMVTAHVDDTTGEVHVVDRFATSMDEPPAADCKQNWELVGGAQVRR